MMLLLQVLLAALGALPVARSASYALYPDLSDFKKDLKVNAQRCANTHHVQYLQVMAAMEGPMQSGYDRNSKCFICCMMGRYQLMTADGEFLDGNMRRYAMELPESQTKSVAVKYMDTCLREDNDDTCEKCYQFAKCYYEHAKTQKDGNRKEKNQIQQLNKYYQSYSQGNTASGRVFQSVGNWAQSRWSQAASGAQGLLPTQKM